MVRPSTSASRWTAALSDSVVTALPDSAPGTDGQQTACASVGDRVTGTQQILNPYKRNTTLRCTPFAYTRPFVCVWACLGIRHSTIIVHVAVQATCISSNPHERMTMPAEHQKPSGLQLVPRYLPRDPIIHEISELFKCVRARQHVQFEIPQHAVLKCSGSRLGHPLTGRNLSSETHQVTRR